MSSGEAGGISGRKQGNWDLVNKPEVNLFIANARNKLENKVNREVDILGKDIKQKKRDMLAYA